jgi:hypothetical protein
MPTGTGRLAIV